MGQVAVTINGRTFRLRCGDGEEGRLMTMATMVKQRVDNLVSEFGNVGDDRLMLMAALMIADELLDARDMLDEVTRPAPPQPGARSLGNA